MTGHILLSHQYMKNGKCILLREFGCHYSLREICPQRIGCSERVCVQQEWTYFPGKDDSDASIDLLWRVELHGVYCNVALSEFKRPYSIDIGEWENGVVIFSRMGKKARKNSQQITRYLFLTAIPFARFCDLLNTVSIAPKGNPNSMHKRWDKNLGHWIDEDTPA
jgi:hypothetical protein